MKRRNNVDSQKQLEEWHERLKEEEKIKKQLLSNEEYMLWIEQFMKERSGVFDDEWLYSKKGIKNKDFENVRTLYLFFSVIDSYARNNFIPYNSCEFGCYYPIKYHDIGYEIGFISGQGCSFFVKKVECLDKDNFIDFFDILNNKEQPRKAKIENYLLELNKLIEVMLEDNTPREVISDCVNKTLKKSL